jgi:H+/Cl- antiporter ClcA
MLFKNKNFLKTLKFRYFSILNSLQIRKLDFFIKWTFISVLISILIGSVSAIFLISLDWITSTRENNFYLIYFLPLVGLLIGYFYHFYGKNVEAGNKLILQEYDKPKKIIPLKMTPMIYFGTIFTHLFGASAGREGTAIQMSASISDQISRFFHLDIDKRRIILLCAIASGFAAVFGTPFAGILFALELILFKKVSYKSLFPIILSAFGADFICQFLGGNHTQYFILSIPILDSMSIAYTIFAGILFGVVGFLFIQMMKIMTDFFKKTIKFSPLRPFFGGIIILFLILIFQTTEFIGLGIPSIVKSFEQSAAFSSFLLKIIFTVITLSSGFKGGEVTPLFFIGATLGSALAIFIPLPTELLAGIGFVAVFAGATKTPIACSIMGLELFGSEAEVFIITACFIATLSSGYNSIFGTNRNYLFRKY